MLWKFIDVGKFLVSVNVREWEFRLSLGHRAYIDPVCNLSYIYSSIFNLEMCIMIIFERIEYDYINIVRLCSFI
jgi:hypothetical protein